MSTRAGGFITFREVLAEVDTDTTRYFLAAFSPDTAMTFDLRCCAAPSRWTTPSTTCNTPMLGCARSNDSPQNGGVVGGPLRQPICPSSPTRPKSSCFARSIGWVRRVAKAAALSASHRLTGFGQEFATAFHRFCADCRIVTTDPSTAEAALAGGSGEERDPGDPGLLAISAPETM